MAWQSFSRLMTARAVACPDDDLVAIHAFAGPRLSSREMPCHIDITRNPLRNAAGKVRRSTFRIPTVSKC